MALTGVSDSEIAYAKAHDTEMLIGQLRAAGHHPVTDPKRQPIF